MNAIAGIIIGVANGTWIARLLALFLWGVVYCVYVSSAERDRRGAFVAKALKRAHPLRWGMSPAVAFYLVEYWTAALTCLVFSVASGLVRGLF